MASLHPRRSSPDGVPPAAEPPPATEPAEPDLTLTAGAADAAWLEQATHGIRLRGSVLSEGVGRAA